MLSEGYMFSLMLALCSATASPALDFGAVDAPCVATNAPVLTWSTRVDDSGVFCYRVVVSNGADTGFVCLANEPFPGLHVYDNTTFLLAPGTTYNYVVEETQLEAAPGKPPVPSPPPSWVSANGSFCTVPSLPAPLDEVRASFLGNFSTIYSNGFASILSRVQPSGFLPTSVSGGYGGARNMFVRDTCAMLVALMEADGCGTCLSTVRAVLNFTLSSIEQFNLTYAPHVMTSDATFSRIVSMDVADQTDGTMHLALVFSAFVDAARDAAFAARFYPLVARLLNHYVAPGASLAAAPGVPYLNTSLQLLLNPNLEHSRLSVYWTSYDALTNAFACEALRGMARVAASVGDAAQAGAWQSVRATLLAGLAGSLASPAPESLGAPVYAELIGEPHFWWPGAGNAWPPGPNRAWSWPPAPLWGLSFVNLGVAAAFFRVLGRAGDDAGAAGLDEARFFATRDAYRRHGSFLWLTDDARFSALVSTTHINASTHSDGDRAVIVKGLGWELAWAARRSDWLRLLTLSRWLGYAAAGNMSLPAESYNYDCMRQHGKDCYGDPGNGEQVGWFAWGAAVAAAAVERATAAQN